MKHLLRVLSILKSKKTAFLWSIALILLLLLASLPMALSPEKTSAAQKVEPTVPQQLLQQEKPPQDFTLT